jgi:hypothetical protein
LRLLVFITFVLFALAEVDQVTTTMDQAPKEMVLLEETLLLGGCFKPTAAAVVLLLLEAVAVVEPLLLEVWAAGMAGMAA